MYKYLTRELQGHYEFHFVYKLLLYQFNESVLQKVSKTLNLQKLGIGSIGKRVN